jgi:ABC-2 type transport system ATP-binding protein
VHEAIITQGLTRCFGETLAADQLNLRVDRGEVFGLLGPNGAGKTTTVRLLAGVLRASAGRAQVLGLDVATQATEIRRQVGVLTETPNLYESLSARDNLLLYGDLYGVPKDTLPQRVQDVLDEFGLSHRADDLVGSYSKGMRQRLAMTRALLHKPALLFLDEPTASLDPAAARMVTDTIQELSRKDGRTVFLCTHNLNEAQRLCDRVGVIDHGKLLAVGAPRDLARQLWQRVWVEIDLHGELSAEVDRVVARMPTVLSRRVEGGRFLLEVDDEKTIPEVVEAISAAGGRIYGVRAREHSLEDVYFEIQGGGGPTIGGGL